MEFTPIKVPLDRGAYFHFDGGGNICATIHSIKPWADIPEDWTNVKRSTLVGRNFRSQQKAYEVAEEFKANLAMAQICKALGVEEIVIHFT